MYWFRWSFAGVLLLFTLGWLVYYVSLPQTKTSTLTMPKMVMSYLETDEVSFVDVTPAGGDLVLQLYEVQPDNSPVLLDQYWVEGVGSFNYSNISTWLIQGDKLIVVWERDTAFLIIVFVILVSLFSIFSIKPLLTALGLEDKKKEVIKWRQ